MNWVSPKLHRNETKQTRLVQNFTETKQNELGYPKLSRKETKRIGLVQNFPETKKNKLG